MRRRQKQQLKLKNIIIRLKLIKRQQLIIIIKINWRLIKQLIKQLIIKLIILLSFKLIIMRFIKQQQFFIRVFIIQMILRLKQIKRFLKQLRRR